MLKRRHILFRTRADAARAKALLEAKTVKGPASAGSPVGALQDTLRTGAGGRRARAGSEAALMPSHSTGVRPPAGVAAVPVARRAAVTEPPRPSCAGDVRPSSVWRAADASRPRRVDARPPRGGVPEAARLVRVVRLGAGLEDLLLAEERSARLRQ